MIKAIYPGSFDPITKGHLDIIRRAAKICDKLYVAVMENKAKHCFFTAEERKDLIIKCVNDLHNVEVVIGEGLTVDYAKTLDCKMIIRGIRAVSDYENELALATANMTLDAELETILLVSKPELSFLSSSIAKEVASFGGDVSSFFPEVILDELTDRLKN